MGYATIEDLQAAFSERELAELTDPEGTGTPDETKLTRALDEADRQINEALQGRYDLALVAAAESPRLRDIACDIARYRLYDRQVLPDDNVVIRRYKELFIWLKSIRDGEIRVEGLDDALLETPNTGTTPAAPARDFVYGEKFVSRFQECLP